MLTDITDTSWPILIGSQYILHANVIMFLQRNIDSYAVNYSD